MFCVFLPIDLKAKNSPNSKAQHIELQNPNHSDLLDIQNVVNVKQTPKSGLKCWDPGDVYNQVYPDVGETVWTRWFSRRDFCRLLGMFKTWPFPRL